MPKLPLVPRPVAWLSAVLLYVFMGFLGALVAAILPRLVEIGEESPRLAALGYLALWTSPIPLVTLLHHVIHTFLDRADGAGAPSATAKIARGLLPGVVSLWAGAYAWFVIFFATTFMVFAWMVISPPDRGESAWVELASAFTWPFDGRGRAGVHTLGWVIVAAQLYDLERAIKKRASRGEA